MVRVTRAATARAERAHAAALLTELPTDIAALLLLRLDVHSLARLACTARKVQPFVEAALRMRAAEASAWTPCILPPGEPSFLPLLLRSDRRRSLPQQPISAGSWHSLLVDRKGQIYSCGVERSAGPDRRGLLGHGVLTDLAAGVPLPSPILALADIKIRSVAAGNKHSLAVSWGGALYSWGRCADGQCGHGDVTRKAAPTRVTKLAGVRVVAVAAGGYHSAVATDAGHVFTFGSGARGRIGHGDEKDRREPTRVQALVGVDISDVSCGYKHSMALSKLGHVYTWGKGKHGRLGHDDASNKLSPARVAPQAFGGRRVVGISAGGHHSAAVAAGGAVFTWGLNDNAQLGLGEPRGGANGINAYRPRRVTDLSSFHVRSVAAGAAHTLALTHEGEVWAWGLAADGRLGLAGNGAQHGASGEVVSRPRRVRLGAAQPEAGGSGGRARVGGEVPFRQQLGAALQAALALGVRHEQRRATPEPPPPAAHRVVALSAGTGSHCLAVTDDGLLWSWGRSEPVRALPHPASRAVVASALPSRVPDQEGREGAPPPLRLCA